MDISNGPGIRVSLFVSGCNRHCPQCFNPETWDFKSGKKYDHIVNNKLMELCSPDYVAGLSILGGEPLHPRNIADAASIAMQFKHRYQNKTIWLWTGYTWEELKKLYKPTESENNSSFSELLRNLDVIVDGPFIQDQKDLTLKWRGSSNQRIWMRGGATNKMSVSENMWYDMTDSF